MKGKKIAIILIVAVILGALGFLAFFSYKKHATRLPSQIIVEGIIEEINGRDIKLNLGVEDPDSEVARYNYKNFIINEKTKIFKYGDKIKSEEQFKKEYEDFNKLQESFKNQGREPEGIEVPSWYVKEEIGLSDLKQGQRVRLFMEKTEENTGKQKIIQLIVQKDLNLATGDISASDIKTLEIWGKIKDISQSSVSISFMLAAGAEEITAEINSETKISRWLKKSEREFKKEYEEFTAKLEESGEITGEIKAPSWYIKEDALIKDLKKDQDVMTRYYKDKNEKLIAAEIVYIVKKPE